MSPRDTAERLGITPGITGCYHDETRPFRGVVLGLAASLPLWALILWLFVGCAPHDDPLLALDRAAALGLTAPREVRPYARLEDWPSARGYAGRRQVEVTP